MRVSKPFYLALVLFLVFFAPLFFYPAEAQGGVTVTITNEVSGNNNTGRTAAAALNDQWIADTQSVCGLGIWKHAPTVAAHLRSCDTSQAAALLSKFRFRPAPRIKVCVRPMVRAGT
ncbi:hypothetical protein ARMA_2472 [Ardenticatena maritima]|uniref:Uncharacterized protein n=1 Tax=Ardenticatena maritima TaxID=872965 RepID=A0A0M8KAZ5_9CHLR|nr:hypothetical protein [Ardenticatena maritima]KPL86533.1 hypothetical protein SE16_14795 [Ardenticatena maritima]GAP64049.1 hypothetical protein ARMA_2472 [Ardenticatena maritima]